MFEKKSVAASCSQSGLQFAAFIGDPSSDPVTVSGILLDPVREEDEPLLYQTFASTRADEMAMTGWNAGQQESFLRMQYEAQRSSYRMQLPDAQYWVVRRGSTPVGRLIVDRRPQDIHIVDIALLPQFRAQGIGSTLMAAIMTEARADSKSVSLHVERFNPALQWYERLGFTAVSAGPIYLEMVWRPGSETPLSRQENMTESKAEEVGMAYVDLSD
jgi:ribosomal protein S18 acetylase RimI-like enzyme